MLTARAVITKVEILGFTPYYFVMNPVDWERIETTQLTAGQYVPNAEGSRKVCPSIWPHAACGASQSASPPGVPTGTA
jgi:hypothetical protein